MAGPSPPHPQTSFAGLNGTRCRLRAREPRAACVARAGPASCSRKSPRLGSKSHRGKGAASRGPAVAKAWAAEAPPWQRRGQRSPRQAAPAAAGSVCVSGPRSATALPMATARLPLSSLILPSRDMLGGA